MNKPNPANLRRSRSKLNRVGVNHHVRRRRLFESLEPRHLLTAVSLVSDLNTHESSTEPEQLVEVGSLAYFIASDVDHGRELWQSDGTEAGTVMVSDLRPGPADSYFYELTNVDGTLFFSTFSYTSYGAQLWKIGSTGPELVKDLSADGTYPSNQTAVGGLLFFRLDDFTSGRELWVSDSQTGATSIVQDINAGSSGSYPTNLTAVGNTLFFVADDGSSGRELWTSTGASNAVQVADLNDGDGTQSYYNAFSYSAELVAVGSTAIFTANDGSGAGETLFASDGASIVPLGNTSATSFSSPDNLTTVGSRVFFAADGNDGSGRELWSTDGSLAGTAIAYDQPGGVGLDPEELIGVGDDVFFSGYTSTEGRELWKYDGTTGGTAIVADIFPGLDAYLSPNSSYPEAVGTDGTNLLFSANDGSSGRELWVSDGTGAAFVKDIAEGVFSSDPEPSVIVNGVPLLIANDATGDLEVYTTDGTSVGTAPIKDIVDVTESSLPSQFNLLAGEIYFGAVQNVEPLGGAFGTTAVRLFKSDGTAGGTEDITSQLPDIFISPFAEVVASGNYTFFQAYDSTNGYELWRTDGTVAGTVLVNDILPGIGGSYPTELTDVDGTLYFVATDGTNGRELWKSQGVVGDAVMIDDIGPGAIDGYISDLNAVGDKLIFQAYSATAGYEWWSSNGTPSGTGLIKDITPGPGSTTFDEPTVSGGNLFFVNTTSSSRVLWKTDGTTDGTNSATDGTRAVGPVTSFPRELEDANGTLFFRGFDSASGYELWKSDGTDSGTLLVSDSVAGASGAVPTYITAVGDQVFFVGDTSATTGSLWKSDGTAAGTSVVRDFDDPATGYLVSNLVGAGGTLLFAANTSANGYELWTSDGTAAGTMLAADINPGSASSDPEIDLGILYEDAWYFSAVENSIGRELYRVTVNMDFGDAPSTFGTTIADDGARHIFYADGIRLGATADHDPDGTASIDALGDDNLSVDDEDGVTIGTIQAGLSSSISVDVTTGFAGADGTGFVDAWIDFDQNGVFDAVSERITPPLGAAVSGAGNVIGFTAPDGNSGSTYLRVRLSSEGGLDPTGVAADGEVEDYVVNVLDVTAPTVTAPAPITVEGNVTGGADASVPAVAAFLTGATAIDNVDPAPSLSNDAVSPFLLGDTTVTFSSTDSSGNTATAQSSITVVDTTSPILTVPGDVSIAAESPAGTPVTSASVVAFLSAASASDIVDASPTITNDASGTLPVGTTLVTFTATDASGNSVSASANVTVRDRNVFVVNNPGDAGDSNPGDGIAESAPGVTTLRAAIEEANASANILSNSDEILFDLAASQLIAVGSALPFVTDAVIIDGTSDPDYIDAPVIEIDGSAVTAGGVPGLRIQADDSQVRGLAIHGFSADGVFINNASSVQVEDNYIGIDAAGADAGNGLHGVRLVNSPSNLIQGNVISGNAQAGVLVVTSSSVGNQVFSNQIGTSPDGLTAIPNGLHGVYVIGAPGTVIGGVGQGNLISGNNATGVTVLGSTASGTQLKSNIIGLNAVGTAAVPNGSSGVIISTAANQIGGTLAGEANVISANLGSGMYLRSVAADNNVVQGNFFGTDATGELDLGNGGYGIFVSQGETNQIGGFTAGAGNVISGNNSVGVVVANANGTQVVGNTIGTNLAGDTEISNFRGLQVLGGSTNTGVVDNLVSGNNALGILIDGPTTTSTTVQGNLIGVSRDQTTQIDNGQFGILLRSSSNTIGGAGAGEGNVISGAGNGIFVVLPTTTGNQIVGNFVGTDTTGANALGVDVGINIGGGATGNVVGPNNTIANNGTGVRNFSGGEGNQITENVMFGNTLIGIDIPGLGATPNDAGDADEGPNRKQNKADLLIASMTSQPGNTTQFDFDYSVDTDVANATYPLTVEFFLSDANGQGAQFLTADTYTATGPASHSVTIDNSQLLYLPEFATATVTDAAGNTSEFSLAIPIDSGMEAAFASPPPALQVAPFHAMDVNQDRQVSLSDALDVINTLSDQSAASGESARNAVFATDVSGDGATTPLDLLLILNHLSQERLSDQLISQLAMDASDDFSDEIAELERQHDEALSGFLF